jgi:hypothetical protein
MLIENIYEELLDCCRELSSEFNTRDVIMEFSSRFPNDWVFLQQRCGIGGKGNGKHSTVNCYIGQMLRNLVKQGNLRFARWGEAPEGWGNPEIAYWRNIG